MTHLTLDGLTQNLTQVKSNLVVLVNQLVIESTQVKYEWDPTWFFLKKIISFNY